MPPYTREAAFSSAASEKLSYARVSSANGAPLMAVKATRSVPKTSRNTAAALVVLVLVLAVYLLNDFDRIIGGMRELIPVRWRGTVTRYARDIDAMLSHFLRGQLTVMAILAVLYSVAYALLGLRLEVGASRQGLESVLAGKIPDLPTRRFLLKNLERLPEGGWRWRFNLDAIRANYHALSGPLPLVLSFSGPALFLKGQHSDYILPEDEPRIRSSFPAAHLLEVPGAGHWVHYDAPHDFTGTLRRFLRQSESASSPR